MNKFNKSVVVLAISLCVFEAHAMKIQNISKNTIGMFNKKYNGMNFLGGSGSEASCFFRLLSTTAFDDKKRLHFAQKDEIKKRIKCKMQELAIEGDTDISVMTYSDSKELVAFGTPFGFASLAFYDAEKDQVQNISDFRFIDENDRFAKVSVCVELIPEEKTLLIETDIRNIKIDLTNLVFFKDAKKLHQIVKIDDKKSFFVAIDKHNQGEMRILENDMLKSGAQTECNTHSNIPITAAHALVMGKNNQHCFATFATSKGHIAIYYWRHDQEKIDLVYVLTPQQETPPVKSVFLDVENNVCLVSFQDEQNLLLPLQADIFRHCHD